LKGFQNDIALLKDLFFIKKLRLEHLTAGKSRLPGTFFSETNTRVHLFNHGFPFTQLLQLYIADISALNMMASVGCHFAAFIGV
jgi:hypothetical protein